MSAIEGGILGVLIGLSAGAFFNARLALRFIRQDKAALETLAATVAKMQADQRTGGRPAGAPPLGGFSFKGSSHG